MTNINLTCDDIDKMSYNDLIGLTQETNRVPGGISTILSIISALCINEHKTILEIGTSTGNTAIELANITGCHVTGVDLNRDSLSTGRKRALQFCVNKNVEFLEMDATNLNFENESFDIVLCGNVTSYIHNKEKALSEYFRVLKPGGFLIAIPMFYITHPGKAILQQVSKAMSFKFDVKFKIDWLNFFELPGFNLVNTLDFKFKPADIDKIKQHCNTILGKKHLKSLIEPAYNRLRKKYSSYIELFNDNLSHMGFSVIILQKEYTDMEPELFKAFRYEEL